MMGSAAAGAMAAPGAAAQGSQPRQYIMLRKILLRNTPENQTTRTSEFLEKSMMPALQRAGTVSMGFFASLVAPDTPFYLVAAAYPSLSLLEASAGKLKADAQYQAALKAYDSAPGLQYQRYETSLLYSFSKWPAMVVPPAGKAPRVFELRTYESNDSSSLAEKIRMFDEGEIDIFKKTGLEPVFFGETIFGERQPNLTYMLWYDDLTARDANWKKFVSHPEWTKLKATPGWSDAEIVSNISNIFLRPLPFSPIK